LYKELLNILVDPTSKAALRLEVHQVESEEILAGGLHDASGHPYPIVRGIPRFVLTHDQGQLQTSYSFGFKWQQIWKHDSPESNDLVRDWLVQRYGFKDPQEMSDYFNRHQFILDAGCGNGLSSSQWLTPENKATWVGADISVAVDVAQERLSRIPSTHFVQADLLQLPFRDQTFDTIFSEGVLHHTPSTEQALKALVPLLKPGGEFLFYVYRQKGPIREFTDDYIRQIVSPLPPEKALELLRPLTLLGQALAELKVEVEVPEDIPYLSIKAGRYDVQRLIYWHFAKMYWNDKLSFEKNEFVNFDWYHPRYAHRQTEAEVKRWCAEAGLSITHFDTQESGFTVRATRS